MLSAKQQLVLLQLCGYTYKERQIWYEQVKQEPSLSQIPYPDFMKVMQHLNSRTYTTSKAYLSRCIAELNLLEPYCLSIWDQAFPFLWRQLPQPPHQVYWQGNLQLLNKPLVSIIGNRKMTTYGQAVIKELVLRLVRQGWGCVSGLALGVDKAVHTQAIAYGQDTTVGIIATGFEQFYPLGNRALQQEMAQHQLIISEFLPSQRAYKSHFIMRNRLVAGISPITILIESASKGGSLITANYALQYNRELYVVPGRIFDQQSIGCNTLIANGATMIYDLDQAITDMAEIMSHAYCK